MIFETSTDLRHLNAYIYSAKVYHYMMKKLFLDDIRTIDMVYDKSREEEFDIVRTYDAFVTYIKSKGLPKYISFDNDLGLDSDGNVAKDGYACVKWLVYKSGLDLTDLDFYVHSANPVAAEQIKSLLKNYIAHQKSEDYKEHTK